MADPQQLLSLKVMRLSKPSFGVQMPPSIDVSDPSLPATQAYRTLLQNAVPETRFPVGTTQGPDPIAAENVVEDLSGGLSHMLNLPSSFGNIYLGETFSSYLCINNESKVPVHDVTFKVELQTSSQRFTLADTNTSSTSSGPLKRQTTVNASRRPTITRESSVTNLTSAGETNISLLPSQSQEFIIHHEIKELGIHILVCSVHYTPGTVGGPVTSHANTDRDRRFFRKFYKFQVLNPLSVKTKVNSLEDGRIYLEAQVQNMTTGPLYLERMRFDVKEGFKVRGFGVDSDEGTRQAPEPFLLIETNAQPAHSEQQSTKMVLDTQESQQYLYLLSPLNPRDLATRASAQLGKLDIIWRSTLGAVGRLQTSQLTRKVPNIEPFEIRLVSQPELVRVETLFSLKLEIKNNSQNEKIRVVLTGIKTKMGSILLSGRGEVDVGYIEPMSCLEVSLDFFPLVTGLHKVTGLQITDKISGIYKEIESLAVIRVI